MNRTAPILLPLAIAHTALLAATLYETDFDNFPTGDNGWAGFDGWVSNDSSSGAQAIDDGLFAGALGKTAALGFNRPNNTFTFVFRPINYDPAIDGNTLIEFRALFGIEDSTSLTNFRRDDFFFSFYNIGGELLASIRLSNVDASYGFWRQDGFLQEGGSEVYTGQGFIRGELHSLSALIDLNANRWSATLDGIPLFDEVVLNGTGVARSLGPVAVEWGITRGTPFGYGDNWILVADLRVETVEADLPPPVIDTVSLDATGRPTLSWQAIPGFDYTVEYSSDLIDWFSDLPDSMLSAPATPQTFEFTDTSTPLPAVRFYRVRRVNAS